LGNLRLTMKTYYGELTVEGNSLLDFKKTLSEIGITEDIIDNVIDSIISKLGSKDLALEIPTSLTPSKPEQVGIIEYGSDGSPHITVSPQKLTARDVIGLLLYSKSPNSISMNELAQLVANNWKNVEMPYISATLSQMRSYVIKEGSRGSYSYRLSGSGKSWIESELLPKLKVKPEDR
jgi:hypothetical protein